MIRCYDLRRVEGGEVARLQRVCEDNQRVEFEVGGEGQWVVSGGQDGRVRLWDLGVAGHAETGVVPVAGEWMGVEEGEGGEVVNGVAMHPAWGAEMPYLATVSGCRSFPAYEEESDSGEEENSVGRDEGQKGMAPELVSRLSLWQVQQGRAAAAGEGVG